MNLKIGYYPILDFALALRQLYSYERFKPFSEVMTNFQNKINETEEKLIFEFGESCRGWLNVIRDLIDITIQGTVSPEETILLINKHPELLISSSDINGKEFANFFNYMFQTYFNSEISKFHKSIFEKVMEISNEIDTLGLINYLLKSTNRVVLEDENTLKFLIKPENKIKISELQTVLLMPSVFACRNFTFWHNKNNYVFYISLNSHKSDELEPSDMLLLSTLAFNDKTRLKMLRMLSRSNYSTGDIADILKMNSSTVSRHFKVFKDAGFVDIFNQEGNTIYYSINKEEIKKSFENIINYIDGKE